MLPFHSGKCRWPHGHNAKMLVTLSSHNVVTQYGASDYGMVADFGDVVKYAVRRDVVDPLDHHFLGESPESLEWPLMALRLISMTQDVFIENNTRQMFAVALGDSNPATL